jgi:hypothetical protein
MYVSSYWFPNSVSGHYIAYLRLIFRAVPYHKTIPRVPQVQLIGNSTVYNHVGIGTAVLKHPSHTAFHKNPILSADEAAGMTPFYCWHMDAALYDHSPSKVTTLYGIQVPQPERPPLHVLFMAHDDQKFSEVEWRSTQTILRVIWTLEK